MYNSDTLLQIGVNVIESVYNTGAIGHPYCKLEYTLICHVNICNVLIT